MNKSSTATDGTPAGQSATSTPTPNQGPAPESSSAALLKRNTSAVQVDGTSSKHSSATNSVTPSPFGSRESSPVRNPRRTASNTKLSASSSRRSSHQDLSPSRQMRSSIPGPTSSSRTLTAASTPTLLPAQDTSSDITTPSKSSVNTDSPRWPVSPRLRSPPPQLNRPGVSGSHRQEPEAPSITVQRPSPSPIPTDHLPEASESEAEDSQTNSGQRTPARAGLETVQEVSLPNSPSPRADAGFMEQVKEKLSNPENKSDSALHDAHGLKTRPSWPSQEKESGSESGNSRTDKRRPTSVPPPLVTRQSSALSAKGGKTKTEGLTQTMTVETETVPSIPQIALSTNTKGENSNGTLKTKTSNETIKPRKDRRKTSRKQPAAVAGTASSKADIFEAKIASAVDEANTSDSEETFVYDSNPPDTGDRSTRRFHSRTPSATSMVSQADRQNFRSIHGVMDGSVGLSNGPKKNMKFVNTSAANGNDSITTGDEDGTGTGRSNGTGSARGTTRRLHHIGRWGREPPKHPSLFDNESPFPNAARSKLSGVASRNSSGPPSPRNHQSARGLSAKRSMQMSGSYDLDETGADDERTPLVGTLRSHRSGRRRGPHNLRQAESQTFGRRSSYLNRFAACLVLTMMLLLVITGAIGFMFATSQPMTNIEIVSISNVVTSEQVLMFDLSVKAHNPNIVVVTIDQANLEIFAKSEHAGTDSDWWDNPHGPGELHPWDDPLDDPPSGNPDDGDDDSKPNVLLGRITEFDSPLTFEGSLFHKGTSQSTGEMQLQYPGNGTSGGSERWERIYQNDFDLIVKGVVKYSLPLSAHVRSATVSGRTHVKPNSASDPSLKPNNTLTDDNN
ncbi:hypothetical protein NLU13_5728 [Sarocladium strictum]|uniref:Vacuolar segregation protein 7 n=1 Tax=Sarocladium strictum TaxID=5046 RepID=A0AA39GI21_SARSR|nr:hypothetical protein NLU13_5728 [Sarocladium strictum]